jgi:hypothetical protein
MTAQARFMIGLSLIVVPTVAFGGATMLNIITGGAHGTPGPQELTPLQVALYRAGHAHAGVLLILSLVIQLALDHARWSAGTIWFLRVVAPAAAILMSAGFFGLAHADGAAAVLYLGAACLAVATLGTGIGLLRKRQAAAL